MPFKDTMDGQTHSYNDGCGEPEHNQGTTHQELKFEDGQFPLESKGLFITGLDSPKNLHIKYGDFSAMLSVGEVVDEKKLTDLAEGIVKALEDQEAFNERVKSDFIHEMNQAKEKALEDQRKEMEESYTTVYLKGSYDQKQRIIEMAEGMKKEDFNPAGDGLARYDYSQYREALTDLITKLKNEI